MASRQADRAASSAWRVLCQFPQPFTLPCSDPPPGWDQAEMVAHPTTVAAWQVSDLVDRSVHHRFCNCTIVFVLNERCIISLWARGHDDGERYLAFMPVLGDVLRQAYQEEGVLRDILRREEEIPESIAQPPKRKDLTRMQHMAMAYFVQQALKEGRPPKSAKHLVATALGVSVFTVRNALREFPKLRTASRGTSDTMAIKAATARAMEEDRKNVLRLAADTIDRANEIPKLANEAANEISKVMQRLKKTIRSK